MKLQSMTDYVLEQEKVCRFKDDCEFAYSVRKYANFLKQPITLEMFVACDEDGNVLEEPKSWQNFLEYSDFSVKGLKPELYKYSEAKSKVLFDGFEIITPSDKCHIIFCKENIECQFLLNPDFSFNVRAFQPINIEDLVKYNLTLTDNAIKQLGL
jgi:hypothetical protein